MIGARSRVSASRERIHADGATIAAADDLTLSSGTTIANDGGALTAARDMALLAQESIVNASGRIEAGGAIDLTAVDGSIANVTRVVDLKRDGSDVRTVRVGRGEITAGGAVTGVAGTDILFAGADLSAGGDVALAAGRDVTLGATELRHDERVVIGHDGYIIDARTHDGSSLSADGAVTILAGRDVGLSSSRVSAGDDATLVAGRDISVLADIDQLYREDWNHKTHSSHESTTASQTYRGSVVSAGGDAALQAGGDLTLEASRTAAGGDLTLEAGGRMALLSGTDTFFHQEKHQRSGMVWQSMQDKGEDRATAVMSEVEAGGDVTVTAGAGIVADYRDAGGLERSLADLAKAPGTAWVADLAGRDDVQWRAVEEHYTHWNHKSQGLSGPAAAVIAIAAAVATYGVGAQVGAAAGLTTTAAATGGGAATLTTTGVMANAGFSALVSQASIVWSTTRATSARCSRSWAPPAASALSPPPWSRRG